MNGTSTLTSASPDTWPARLFAVHERPGLVLTVLLGLLLGLAFTRLEILQRHQASLELLNSGLEAAASLEQGRAIPGTVETSEPGRAIALSLGSLAQRHAISALTPQSVIAKREDRADLLAVQAVLGDGNAVLRARDVPARELALHKYETSARRLVTGITSEVREELRALGQLASGFALVLVMGSAHWLFRNRQRAAVQSAAERSLEARREYRLERPETETRELLQTIIDSIDGGVVVFDADNRLMFGNQVYAEMIRVPASLLQSGTQAEAIYRFLIGRNPENLSGRTVEETVAAQISALRAGGEDTEFTVGDSTYLRRNRVLANGLVIGLRSDITAVKRTQSQLRERTELIELALDATSDGLWDWNVETNQNFLSPRWKALLGYADHEIGNGLSVWQAHMHPLDRDVVTRAVEAHLDQKAPFDIEYRMQHRSGEYRWFHVRGQAVFAENGRPRRMAGFTSDIHDRKMQALELEKTRALLHDAIEALDGGLVRYDPEARLVFCNRRFRELFGYTPELAVPGVHERDLIVDFQQRHSGHLDLAARELIVTEALARTRVAGKPFELQAASRWLRISISATPDGGRVILTTDITRLKNTQAELTLTTQRAEAANVAKSQFLANMSHELRTPLNGVIGMLQVLESAGFDSPHDGHVALALRSGRSLLDLINDILDLSRIQSGALTLEHIAFDLQDLVEDAFAPVSGAAGKKGLALQADLDPALPPALKGDPTRLRQVLINLLGNALKFTEAGSVSLRVTALPGKAVVRYEVEDTGIGISAEQLEHIFDRFTQADTSITRRYGGAGLGLAISQQLVSAMGSTLRIESTVGTGTRLWFELPLEASESRPAALPAAARQAPRLSGRVLVVDDGEVNRLVALAMLERLGLAAEAVASGEAAIRRADELPLDLILMDCQMPELDGFETTRALQARLGAACPPIVALTANVGPRDRELARESGMCDFLAKPLSLEKLSGVLEHWLPSAGATMNAESSVRPATAAVIAPEVLEELRETFDEAGLALLFTTFIASMENFIGQLPARIVARDTREVGRIFHAMKGICGNVGATKLAGLLSGLEGAVREERFEALEAVDDQLRSALAQVTAQLGEVEDIGA